MKEQKDIPPVRLHITLKEFLRAFWKTITLWVFIGVFIAVALHYHVDKTVIGGAVVIFGIVTQAFIGLANLIALVPLFGPIVAKILALPVFWLINGLGYFLSIIAIKRGYSREVINYRILTVVLLIGIVIGFILGKLI